MAYINEARVRIGFDLADIVVVSQRTEIDGGTGSRPASNIDLI